MSQRNGGRKAEKPAWEQGGRDGSIKGLLLSGFTSGTTVQEPKERIFVRHEGRL